MDVELEITMVYETRRKYLSALSKIQNRYVEYTFSNKTNTITEYVLMKEEK